MANTGSVDANFAATSYESETTLPKVKYNILKAYNGTRYSIAERPRYKMYDDSEYMATTNRKLD